MALGEDWPEPVRRVAEFLEESGAEARLEEFSEGTPTAEDAARAVGCDLADIVKSLVLRCDDGYVLALVPGDARADLRALASRAGCRRLRIAGPEQVEEATGFAPGAVAPFPLPRVERIFIERTLLTRERVWVGAGSPRHMAGLRPTELARLARAEPVAAAEERT